MSDSRADAHFTGPALKLAEAAARGDAPEVARLIREQHIDPNQRSRQGMPLLLWPVQTGSAAGTQALLQHGADPGFTDDQGDPAIVYAAKSGIAMLRLFLDHGGDAKAATHDREPITFTAAYAGHWDAVRLLIERGADLEATDKGVAGATLLAFYAAGQFDKAYWLLQHGADPGFRMTDAPDRERIGAQPVLEDLYHYPVDAMRFPELAMWQRRCQELLQKQGHARVAEPQRHRKMRLQSSQ